MKSLIPRTITIRIFLSCVLINYLLIYGIEVLSYAFNGALEDWIFSNALVWEILISIGIIVGFLKVIYVEWFEDIGGRNRRGSLYASILLLRLLIGILFMVSDDYLFSTRVLPANISVIKIENEYSEIERYFFNRDLLDKNNALDIIGEKIGYAYDTERGFYDAEDYYAASPIIDFYKHTFYQAAILKSATPMFDDYEVSDSFLKKLFVYGPLYIIDRFLYTFIPSITFLILYMVILKYKPKIFYEDLEEEEYYSS